MKALKAQVNSIVKQGITFLYRFEHTAANPRTARYLFVALAAVLFLILSVRWNYQDPGLFSTVVQQPKFDDAKFDIANYQRLVEYFRRDGTNGVIIKPFRYRILHPFLASFIPFQPIVALNVVNVLFHIVALIFIKKTLGYLRCSEYEQFLGLVFYVVSYPMLMFGASGWNEPVSLALILAGMYFILKNQWIMASLVCLAGSLNNEKIILLLIFSLANDYRTRKYLPSILYGTIIVVVLIVLRTEYIILNGIEQTPQLDYRWQPSLWWIQFNLFQHWRNYPSTLLTFGFIGAASIIAVFSPKAGMRSTLLPFIAGFMGAVALYIFNFTIAISSGRILWYIYPFGVVLTVKMVQWYKTELSINHNSAGT